MPSTNMVLSDAHIQSGDVTASCHSICWNPTHLCRIWQLLFKLGEENSCACTEQILIWDSCFLVKREEIFVVVRTFLFSKTNL